MFINYSKDYFFSLKSEYISSGNHQKYIITAFCLFLIVLTIVFINIKTKAYIIELGEETLGVIRNAYEIDIILEDLKNELKSTYNMDVVLREDIRLEETNVRGNKLTDVEEIKEKVKKRVSFLVEGYTLVVDGKEIGSLKTKEEADILLEKIKEPFEKEAIKLIKSEDIEIKTSDESKKLKDKYIVKILEKVDIKKEEIPIYKIYTLEKLEEILLTGGEDIKTHIVEVGESFWTIAKIYNISLEELVIANPEKNPDQLQIGDEVNLVIKKPILTVSTTIKMKYHKEIPYDIEIEEDFKRYKNEKEIKIEGKKGKVIETVEETRYNGKVISKNIIDEIVLDEPVSQLIVQGTKERPMTVATGSFVMPTRGRVSSRYGMRNGRMHKGLDISAKVGTPITAADGGKVILAGRSGAYGNLIIIDHVNGYQTKYAHCSKIYVSQGIKVYKGQHIADVGNTGRTTGAHLHLEVLKNGKNINPNNFIGK